jgi:ABC-type Na+ efflux pump permease subunit
MRFSFVAAVAGTELKRLFRSRYYWIPLGILSSLLFFVIPGMLLAAAVRSSLSPVTQQIGQAIQSLPPQIYENIRGDSPGAQIAYGIAVYLLAPIAIVVPMTISSAVGANAIVGERERGTGEFLAHSPLTEKEIFLGKLLSSLVPGYAASLVGFVGYSLLVNIIVGPHVGGWFFPTPAWWILTFWVVPPFIAVAIAVIIRLSARVRTAAAAQQAATLVTVPVIFLSGVVTFGLLYKPMLFTFLIGAGAWILCFFSVRAGFRSVRREGLLGFGSDR